jgi:hypothetical protein
VRKTDHENELKQQQFHSRDIDQLNDDHRVDEEIPKEQQWLLKQVRLEENHQPNAHHYSIPQLSQFGYGD